MADGSLIGQGDFTKDLPNGRLQAGILERLAEQEGLGSRVIVRQSPWPQADCVTCRFLSVGSGEEAGNVWNTSECEGGDLGVGGQRLEWRGS